MNTVDTERLEQLRTIGVPFAGATNDDIRVFDCRILLEWATSLTNEAELRGRESELEDVLKTIKPLDKHSGASWQRGYVSAQMKLRKVVKARLAALLKLGASSRINPSVRTEDNHQEGGA